MWRGVRRSTTSRADRPQPSPKPHASAREVDYLENIAQVQKAWDRELQALRDEITTKANEIEDITIQLSLRKHRDLRNTSCCGRGTPP